MRRFLALVALVLLAAVPAEAAKLTYVKGSTSVFVDVFIQDSSSSTGAGLAGLAFNTSSLVCYYSRADQGDAAATQISLVTATRGTYTSSGFKEKDATNMPGVYELGLPTGVLATGSNYAIVMCKGATNMAPLVLEIQLTGIDMQDAVHLGITGIPNAAAGASGGLLISGSNSGTTTLGAATITGALTVSGGVVVTQSSSNTAGVAITGNGSGNGLTVTGGATGNAASLVGGGTSGAGLTVATTAGNGVTIAPTAGHGISVAANGTSKHGMTVTGGTAGTSDGVKFVAGSGGVALNAATGITVDGCTGCSSSGGTTLMSEVSYVKASTSVIHEIFIKDSSTNLGKTGLAFNSAGLVIAFGRADQGAAGMTACTAATATLGSYTSCGFKEKDSTNAAGVYELGLTTAMLATGADYVTVAVYGVSGTVPTILPIALVNVGLAAIDTKLGTPAGASMSADIAAVQTSATAIKAKTDQVGFSGTNALVEVAAYSSGKTPLYATVEGRTLDVTSTGAAGIDWGNVENATTTVGLTGTTISTSQGIASVSGAVGSVTGAVGSVTGAVGSVTGAVGSVTGAVGSVTGAVGSVTGATASVTNTVKAGGVLRKNTASQTFPIYLVLTSDHITAATSKTVTVQVSVDGGSFGNITGSVAEIGNGWYLVSFSQADTNCTSCAYRATAASTDTRNWYVITGP